MSPATASAASHHTVTDLLVLVLLLLLLPVFVGIVLAPSSRSLTAFTGTNTRHTRSRVSCYDATASGAVMPEVHEDDATANSICQLQVCCSLVHAGEGERNGIPPTHWTTD